jgi:hypothetical protein
VGSFVTAAKNTMLDALTVTYASLHTADPGATGANEVAGGSPAYARKAVTFNAASGAARALNATVQFDVPGSTTITHVGYWNAVSGGTFHGSDPVTNESYTGQGTYDLLASGTTLSLSD